MEIQLFIVIICLGEATITAGNNVYVVVSTMVYIILVLCVQTDPHYPPVHIRQNQTNAISG